MGKAGKWFLILSVMAVIAMVMVLPGRAGAEGGGYSYMAEAQALNDLGLYNGISTENFVPDLGTALNRETGIVMLLRIFGLDSEAQAFNDTEAVLARYSDASQISPWARNAVAYAVQSGLIQGFPDGTIGPKAALNGKAYCTLILRQLGYTPDYNNAPAELVDRGGITEVQAITITERSLIKDDLVGISYGALNAVYSDGGTVINRLFVQEIVEEDIAAGLGLLTPELAPQTQQNTGSGEGGGRVNSIPTANPCSIDVVEDTPKTGQLTGSDADGDSLTYIKVTDPSHGTVAINANGTYTYTPEEGYHGSDSFTFKVNDGRADSQPASVGITIAAVNDAPLADNCSISTEQDTPKTGQLTGTDADGDSLTYIKVTDPAHGTVTINADGTYTYTPEEGYHGSDSFTFKVNDGELDSPPAAASITVTKYNYLPEADACIIRTEKNIPKTGQFIGTDEDGDSLTYTVVTDPAHGTVTINSDGTYTYTPAASYFGSDSFSFKVNDGKADSAPTAVMVLINKDGNSDPAAAGDSGETDEDNPLIIDVLSNDIDPDQDDLSVIFFTQGSNGAVETAGNTLKYMPEADYYGSDTFTYWITDGEGGAGEAVVTLTIKPVNDDPQAENDIAEVEKGNSVLIDVLANDTDVDGDNISLESCTQGNHGMAFKEGNAVRYISDNDYIGSDSFTYTISDGNGGTATASVTVEVKGAILDMYIHDSQALNKHPFEVTKKAVYNIRTSYYHNDCDTMIILYDASSNELDSHDNVSETDSYSSILIELDTGTYYLTVNAVGGGDLHCRLEVR